MEEEEKVYVDTGLGDIIAVIGSEYGQSHWIRRPVLMDKKDVSLGMVILDRLTLKKYNDAIKEVEIRKKRASNKT